MEREKRETAYIGNPLGTCAENRAPEVGLQLAGGGSGGLRQGAIEL